METPTIVWSEPPADVETVDLAERLIREYFAQDRTISSATLRALKPGRSGAIPFTAYLVGQNIGGLVSLQPEFVKLVRNDSEVRSFEEYASGTALVFGQHLARRPYLDPATNITVFGFRLFENGADLLPFFAVAHESPMRACRLLKSFCTRLQDWYGPLPTPVGCIPLEITDSRIDELTANLDLLSSGTAKLVAEVLNRVRSAELTGSLTRVHGDLHLENLLVPHNAEFCYLIDFANSSNPGSPCIDIARLESDMIYRTLPYDMSPDEVGRFESWLWDGNFGALRQLIAGALVMTMRQTLGVVTSPNAAIWILTGRILNGLKMVARTWLAVRPYKFDERKRGIVASLRVLAGALGDALQGRTFDLSPSDGEYKIAGEGLRSVRWLYANRHYDDAFDLSQLLSRAGIKCQPEQGIIGSLAALATSVPDTPRDTLFRCAALRARGVLSRGLRALYQAIHITKQEHGRDLTKAMRLFGTARQLLDESGDSFFASVALDQMARCQQESGEPYGAKITFRDAIQLKEKAGDTAGLATSLGGLGLLEMSSGYYHESRLLFERDLQLAKRIGDRRAEIKICNWLGQVALLGTLDIIGSVAYLNKSIDLAVNLASDQQAASSTQRYSPALDLAYAYIGLGFAFIFSENLEKATECANQAAKVLGGVVGIAADLVSTQLELQTAMTLALSGQSWRALIRTQGALSHLKTLSLLDFCDYSIRAIRFYTNHGDVQIASRLVREVVDPIRSLRLVKLHAFITASEGTT